MITASVTVSPRYASASALSFCRIIAEISWGVYFFASILTRKSDPISRLMELTVRSLLVTACRLATWPTRRSLFLEKATMDGVVLPPSELGITTASPPSITATQEFVVPRSIPMTLDISIPPLLWLWGYFIHIISTECEFRQNCKIRICCNFEHLRNIFDVTYRLLYLSNRSLLLSNYILFYQT